MIISIVGFDTETTGLQADKHKIIELCVQRFDYDTQSTSYIAQKPLVWRFNPMRSIDKAAQAVHHISLADLKDCPVFDTYFDEIYSVFNVDVLVGHNAVGFDVPFMEKEYKLCNERRGIADKTFQGNKRVVDTALESNWATAYGKMPKLEELCFACGVEYNRQEAHAAEYDVRVMMDCFFCGVRKGLYTLA